MRNTGWFLLGVLTALIFGGAAVQSGWYERPAFESALDCANEEEG